MDSSYFKVIDEYHSKGFTFYLKIDWNVEAIAGEAKPSGYIVQRFSRQSEPVNFKVNDTEYYEAWKVESGCNIDRGNECDDRFSVDASLGESLRSCLKTAGKYILKSDVFWISQKSELYDVIDSWPCDTVKQANGLHSSYDRPDDIEKYFVFTRPTFIHEWSLLSAQEIEEKLLSSVLSYCPRNTKRDTELATDLLDYVFENSDEDIKGIKEIVLQKWKKQISHNQ